MKIYVLFIHHKETYPGQHAPEAHVVCDEYILEQNPTWLEEAVDKHLSLLAGSIDSHAVVAIEVDQDAIVAALNPEPTVVKGDIVSPPESCND